MQILYKSKNAVVINKPFGTPSQADKSGDGDALSLTSKALKESGENAALWLVHRLDRMVGGLLVFARTKESAAKINSIIASGGLQKEYIAVVEGEACDGELVDYLYHDTRANKAFVVNPEARGAKEAVLSCKSIAMAEYMGKTVSLVKISLKTGRFHQIRAQLSSRGNPIIGDGKYGSKIKYRNIALFSCMLCCTIPNEEIKAYALPDLNTFPWSIFDEEKYGECK
jgi:23S rRNA pseudouridine1911/1915/1917 synthase